MVKTMWCFWGKQPVSTKKADIYSNWNESVRRSVELRKGPRGGIYDPRLLTKVIGPVLGVGVLLVEVGVGCERGHSESVV